jgi:hypoxanthine phosphoribosyltransferase
MESTGSTMIGQTTGDPTQSYARDAIRAILLDAEQIQEKLQEIGHAISRDYAGLDPVLVAVLRGGAMVMADLLRTISIPVLVDFIAISSYGPESRATGAVRFLKDLEIPIAGRHVILVEDMLDTGLTLNYILRSLRSRQPASLEVAALFDKPARRLANIRPRYRGFELPDEFVVGYGLDLDERYRNLPFLCVLKPEYYGR